jgi:hypothetical protein
VIADGNDNICTCDIRRLLYIFDGGAKGTAGRSHEGFEIEVGFTEQEGERRPELSPKEVKSYIRLAMQLAE